MLSNESFIEESLISNLYYLRSLREYSLQIQLTFPPNYIEYINKFKEFGQRCEELGTRITEYANLNINSFALESNIFVSNYTLKSEKLTEKLFNIDINTDITEKELMLKPGSISNPSDDLINIFNNINNDAIKISNDFKVFLNEIKIKIKNQEIFTYSYPSLFDVMEEEINVYLLDLNRLNAKSSTDPTFVIDYEYFFNNLLLGAASFIRGQIDPVYLDIFTTANNFVLEYQNIIKEYEILDLNPENQKNMTENSLELVKRFQEFITLCLENILNKEIYLIVPVIAIDNALTAANFFEYNLLKNENIAVL